MPAQPGVVAAPRSKTGIAASASPRDLVLAPVLGVAVARDEQPREVGARQRAAASPDSPARATASSRTASAHANSPISIERLAEVGQELEPLAVVGRQQRRGAAEQVRGRRHVAARERAAARPTRAGRPRAAPSARPCSSSGPSSDEVAVRLLEVVAEDLLVLASRGRARRLTRVGPVDEALVQRRPRALEQPAGRRRRGSGCGWKRKLWSSSAPARLGADELLAVERRRGGARPASAHRVAARARRPRRSAKTLADDRRRARSPPARSRSSRSSRAASSAWIVGGTASVRELAVAAQPPSSRRRTPSSISIESSCSTKSGLPSAASTIARARLVREIGAPEEVLERPARRLPRGERLERESSRRSAAPPAPAQLEQLGPGRADEQDGASATVSTRCSIEVEERRLRPVDVVEDDDERAAGARATRAASRTAQKSSSTGTAASESPIGRGEALDDAAVVVADERRELRRAPSAASSSTIPAAWRDDLGERPERDAAP